MISEELFNKWVAALRSGDYKQNTDSTLRTADNRFCCLGVLCDLVDPNGWLKQQEAPLPADSQTHMILPWYNEEYPRSDDDMPDGRYTAYIPYVLIPGGEQYRIARMNDGGSSFSIIADYLEKNKSDFVE